MPEYDNFRSPEQGQENVSRGRNLTFSYGAGDLDNKPADKLTDDEEKLFGKVELYDSGDRGGTLDTPPPEDPNKVKRDDRGRITSQENPWGKQWVTYNRGYPDEPDQLNSTDSDGKSVLYSRERDGTYTSSNGQTYKKVDIDQNTGDITVSRLDGSKNIQYSNGDSEEFDSQGRQTFAFDYAKRQTIALEYDPETGDLKSRRRTDLRTGLTDTELPVK